MNHIYKLYILVFTLLAVPFSAFAKQPVPVKSNKTFLDSMEFNYEKTIWGKTPAVPLKPLGSSQKSTLKDLGYYGVADDEPMLSTDRILPRDTSSSSYDLKPRTIPQARLTEKDEHHQHIGLGVSLGGTMMSYDSDFGGGKVAFSPSFHFMYEYYLYRNWGFMVGVDVAITTGMFEATNYADKYDLIDKESELLKFSYSVGKIKELNKVVNLTFPVTLAFSTERFYAHGGFKVGVPVLVKYDQTLSDCDFTCEIPVYNTVIHNANVLAVGDREHKYSGKFSSSPIMLMLAFDAGYRFHINKKFDLMCGVFIDKALYRIRYKAEQDKDNVQYTEKAEMYDFLKTSNDIPAQLIHSSVLVGRQMTTGERIAKGIGYTSFGVKLSFCFNSYGKDYFPHEEGSAKSVPDVQKPAAKSPNTSSSKK